MLDFDQLARELYTGVICDVLDSRGFRNQAMDADVRPVLPTSRWLAEPGRRSRSTSTRWSRTAMTRRLPGWMRSSPATWPSLVPIARHALACGVSCCPPRRSRVAREER